MSYYKYMRFINNGIKVSIIKKEEIKPNPIMGFNKYYNPESVMLDIVFKVEDKIYLVRHIKYLDEDLYRRPNSESIFYTTHKDHDGDYTPIQKICSFKCGLPFGIDAVKDQIKKFVKWQLFNGEPCLKIIL